MSFLKPHYIREYDRLISSLRRRSESEESAMERAVGGNYIREGQFQAELVLSYAPETPFTLVDVGCGSGRAAYALKDVARLRYVGFDVMPELISYARKKADRDDWRFEAITEISVPMEEDSADIIMFMSVFTHLKPHEIKRYLAEAARVVKPGGLLISSFLDGNEPKHRTQFQSAPVRWLARVLARTVRLTFTPSNTMIDWAESAGFRIERVIDYHNGRQHTLIARREAPI